MRILIAPDSYKGSLSSKEVAITIQNAFLDRSADFVVTTVPMADGGEGTQEAMLHATQGIEQSIEICGPLLKPVQTSFGILGDRETVVIETAKICGLTMVPHHQRNPEQTSTFGLGQAIKIALDRGYRKFIIGLGGSATNDGGVGMLQALGVKLTDKNGRPVEANGRGLTQIASIQLDSLDKRIHECEIQIANDVTNPLCGSDGASAVFGPQKGATKKQIQILDQAMSQYAQLMESKIGWTAQQTPGAGAAGGLGFAFLILGGTMKPGAQLVAEATQLQQKIEHNDWVITGEGRTDYQTAYGKLPLYVASLAKQANKKTILLSGSIDPDCQNLYQYFVSLQSIIRHPLPLKEAIKRAEKLLYQAAFDLANLLYSQKEDE